MGKNFWEIRSRLFFPVLAVLFIAITVLSVVNFRVSSTVLRHQINEATSKSLSNIKDNFYEQFVDLKENMDRIYLEKEFIQSLTDEISEKDLRKKYSSLARSFATEKIQKDARVDAFYIYTADHYCVSHYRRADTPTYRYPTDIYDEKGYDADVNAEIVRQYVESDRSDFLFSSYYNPYRQKNVLRFVYKIYIQNRGKLVGYLVCDTDERMLTDRINSYTYYEGQVVCIQPLGDRIAVYSGKPEEQQQKIIDSLSNDIKRAEFTVNTKKVLRSADVADEVFVTSLSRYGIMLYSLYPENMLRDTSSEMIMTIFMITGFILLGVVLVVWFYSNKVSGEFAMMQKNAEYKALQAQINPHFLYNTLETMSSIARRRNCAEVSDMCLALSSMFRYSMGVKEGIVPLQKEVEHIRNYLYVMTTRMQNDIDIKLDIRSEHMGKYIPKLTLQPVVENSLKHGLSGIRGDKRLYISSHDEGDNIVIEIEDNGKGMDADEINKWLNKNEKEEQKESIGLRNIHRRLQLVFGMQYGLKVESNDEYSKVCIVIPQNYDKEKDNSR